jgi:hypothetical protein
MPSVLLAPLHAPSANREPLAVIKRIEEVNRDNTGLMAVGITEAYSIIPQLKDMRNFDLVLETGGKDTRRGQRDNPILRSHNYLSKGAGQLFGCSASTPEELAPERWLTFCVVNGVYIINLHPHAAVQSKDDWGPNRSDNAKHRVAMFEYQMIVFRRLLQLAHNLSDHIIVMGDFNCQNKGTWRSNPWHIMSLFGLKCYDHNIIGMATDIRGFSTKIVEGDGTDHAWMLGSW